MKRIQFYLFIFIYVLFNASAGQGEWKIMPVGNSITAGTGSSNGNGFRDDLYESLLGTNIQFVGPDGASPYFGFFEPGVRTQDLYSSGYGNGLKDIAAAMYTYRPEVILVHIGTNGIDNIPPAPYSYNNGQTFLHTSSGILAEFLKYISQWANGSKGTFVQHILVCKIIPRSNQGEQDEKVIEYNAQIDRIFFDSPPQIATDKITVVDMYSVMNINTDYSDGLHPNDNGYSKISNLYNEILRGILSGDTRRPGQITWKQGLALDAQSAALEWYSTGDDFNSGRANLYELRYAQFLLNSANFSQGVLVPLSRPQMPNNVEAITIQGLIPDQIYNFAIRVWDESNNAGNISENLNVQMPGAAGFDYCDDFSSNTLNNWSTSNCYIVQNSWLKNTCPLSSGWNNSLAVFTAASYSSGAASVEVSMDWSIYADAAGLNAGGIAMMLDTPNYATANGYFILVRNGYINLYEIVDGLPVTPVDKSSIPIGLPAPSAGDNLMVKYFQNIGYGYTFNVFLSGILLGQVHDPNNRAGNGDKLFSGVMLAGGYNNDIKNFCVSVPPLAADSMRIYSGNHQTGQVTEKLANPLAIQVTDVNQLGVSDVQVEFSITDGNGFLSTDSLSNLFNGYLWLEAESGTLVPPMAESKDNGASDGAYVFTPVLDINYNRGLATYQIYIPKEDNYVVWLRVYAPDGSQNSGYFVLADYDTTSRIDFKSLGNWAWYSYPRTYHLNSGFTTMAIKSREPGTRFDKILLTSNTGYTPEGKGGTSQRFSNITDPTGVAYTNLTLSTQSGPVEVTAYCPIVPNGTTQKFSIYAGAHIPQDMNYFPSSDIRVQNGFVGQPLSEKLGLFVTDVYGNRCIGERVVFVIEYGGATFDNGNDTLMVNTNGEGVADASIILGFEAEAKIRAYLPNFPNLQALDFYGRTENQPTRIELADGDAQTAVVGTVLPTPLSVFIYDGSDKPVEGFPVPFRVLRGNGKLNGSASFLQVPSDENGNAGVAFTLGDTAGVDKNVVIVDVPLQNAPIQFSALAKPDNPHKLEKVYGENQQTGAGNTFPTPLTVKVKDRFGNGISNYDVKFWVTNGDGNFDGEMGKSTEGAGKIVKTDIDGLTRVYYTAGRITGMNQVRTDGVPTLPQGYIIFDKLFVNEPQPTEITILDGVNQQATINGVLPRPFKVRLDDAFGNIARPGERVMFTVVAGGGIFIQNNNDTLTVLTNGAGQVEAQFRLGTIAGSQVVKVWLPDYPTVESINFYATAIPGAAHVLKPLSTLSFSGRAASGPVTLSVRVTDEFENFKPGHPVIFNVTSQGGYLDQNKTYIEKNSDGNGLVSVNFYFGTSTAETNIINVSSYKSGTTQPLVNSPITFNGQVEPDVSANMIKISGDNPIQSGQIGTTLQLPFVVQVQDKYGNPVVNTAVTFKATSKGSKIGSSTEANIKTGINGTASIYLTLGYHAGTASDTVIATVPDYPNIASVQFVASATAGFADRISIEGDSLWYHKLSHLPFSIIPRIKITDNRNNPVSNQQVKFTVIRGDGHVNQDTSVNTQTDQNGFGSVTWTLGQKPDTNIVHAYAELNKNPLVNSPVIFRAITVPGDAEKIIRLSAANDTGVVNQVLSEPFQVQVTDFLDNPIVQHLVQFSVSYPATGGLFKQGNGVMPAITLPTDNNGIAEVYYLPVLGQNYVQATAKNNQNINLINSPITFSVFGHHSAAQQMTLLSPASIQDRVATAHTVRIRVIDGNGDEVDGHPIIFEVTKGSGTLGTSGKTWSSKKTVNGIAEEIWVLGSEAGVDKNQLTVSAQNSVGAQLQGSPQIIHTNTIPDHPTQKHSSITAQTDIVIDDNSFSLITVALYDSFGNPVPGVQAANIRLATDSPHVIITQPLTPTDNIGITTGRAYSTRAGTCTIRAFISGQNNFELCCAEAKSLSNTASKLKITSGNKQTGNVGALLKDQLAVQVTDKYNNPIQDIDVEFSMVSGGGYFLESGNTNYTAPSDSQGIVVSTYVMGRIPVTNVVNALLGDIQVSFELYASPGIPRRLEKVTTIIPQNQVGDTLDVPLTVQVFDDNDTPVWNAPVTFGVFSGGEIIGQNPVPTNHLGMASGGFKIGSVAGQQIVEAYVADQTNKVQFQIMAVAGAPAQIQAMDVLPQDTVGTIASTPLRAKVMDEFSNAVSDILVTFRIRDGLFYGAEIIGPDTVRTVQNGIAQVQLRLGGRVTDYVVTASAYGISNQQAVFTIRGIPGKPALLHKHAGDNQSVTMGRELLYPVVMRVTDRFENPVPGEPINFAPVGTSGYVLTSIVTSDSNGLAKCRWVLGNQRENKLWAMKWGLSPNYVEFNAIGVKNAYPVLRPLPKDTTIYAEQTFCFPLLADDDDRDALLYTIPQTPGNLVYDSQNGRICWQPTRLQEGIWNLRFRVEDAKGGFDVDSVNVRVYAAPKISSTFPATDKTFQIPQPSGSQTFSILVAYQDVSKLHFEWYFDDTALGINDTKYLLQGKDFGQGCHRVKVVVSDGVAADSAVWNSVCIVRVEIKSFAGICIPFQGVTLDWRTGFEINNLGFFVLRSRTADHGYQRIHSEILPSTPSGRYHFADLDIEAGSTYYYKIQDVNKNGLTSEHGPVCIEVDVPQEFRVLQNYPNPFNPETRIRFQLPQPAFTRVVIFNTLGQTVRTLLYKNMEPGYHEILWDGRNDREVVVPSGIYYYRISAAGFRETKKMVMLR
ncbi:T9SS type A sorting domain-containing protein [candidate division KSB1 bacterium]|nr:T9SS type A sorting domain-containing protein [candidate division KSB1 bacterium]